MPTAECVFDSAPFPAMAAPRGGKQLMSAVACCCLLRARPQLCGGALQGTLKLRHAICAEAGLPA